MLFLLPVVFELRAAKRRRVLEHPVTNRATWYSAHLHPPLPGASPYPSAGSSTMCRLALSVLLIASLTGWTPAAEHDARIAGQTALVPTRIVDGTLLFNVQHVARAFGFSAKSEERGNLLVLCRDGDEALCIPVPLADVKTTATDSELFVDAETLGRALGFSIQRQQDMVTIKPRVNPASGSEVTSYNAAWGDGRGFQVGQTLPDIPLLDMQGREVRFSQFLGKRYILYCWASW